MRTLFSPPRVAWDDIFIILLHPLIIKSSWRNYQCLYFSNFLINEKTIEFHLLIKNSVAWVPINFFPKKIDWIFCIFPLLLDTPKILFKNFESKFRKVWNLEANDTRTSEKSHYGGISDIPREHFFENVLRIRSHFLYGHAINCQGETEEILLNFPTTAIAKCCELTWFSRHSCYAVQNTWYNMFMKYYKRNIREDRHFFENFSIIENLRIS